ncbi:MAG: hypothetical protein JW744_00710 [Candidatus Diapherotrites archaeon]|uniref:Uncharacterized protein n=1 Tax=Candidatus Iainarchaeum sp. TaxID=3101447 RepID=A0A938YWH9_9ARCH|nr:hypothetical protein [Candidatus Diapherotrites archaeon]
MTAIDDWILFLEENPGFYELSRSNVLIKMLESLALSAKSASSIHAEFPFIEWNDLGEILDSMVKLKVVEEIRPGSMVFYSVSGKGKELLEMYRKTKKFFTV